MPVVHMEIDRAPHETGRDDLRREDVPRHIDANNFGTAPAVVTVLASDVPFEVSRCGTWTRMP